MESMSIDPAAAAIGAQLVDVATRGLGSGSAALPSLTALAPAGAEEVSMLAATAFAAEGQAVLAACTAAQEELARAGMALTEIARMYSQVDGEAAGTLIAGGSRFAGQPFAGGPVSGVLQAETLAGAAGSAAPSLGSAAPPPLAANVAGGVSGLNPSTTVPAAANAASMAMGAGTVPLSSLGQVTSVASAGAAGGGTAPGLASSVDQGETDPDESGDQQSAERVL